MKQNFEAYLVNKYPSLFREYDDADGKRRRSFCGVEAPEHWRPTIDNLCGCIDAYVRFTTLNKRKRTKHMVYNMVVRPCVFPLVRMVERVVGSYKTVLGRKLIQTRYRVDTKFSNIVSVSPSPVQIEQIKSKFGGLRFYASGGDDAVYGMIRLAEYQIAELTKSLHATKNTESETSL